MIPIALAASGVEFLASISPSARPRQDPGGRPTPMVFASASTTVGRDLAILLLFRTSPSPICARPSSASPSSAAPSSTRASGGPSAGTLREVPSRWPPRRRLLNSTARAHAVVAQRVLRPTEERLGRRECPPLESMWAAPPVERAVVRSPLAETVEDAYAPPMALWRLSLFGLVNVRLTPALVAIFAALGIGVFLRRLLVERKRGHLAPQSRLHGGRSGRLPPDQTTRGV